MKKFRVNLFELVKHSFSKMLVFPEQMLVIATSVALFVYDLNVYRVSKIRDSTESDCFRLFIIVSCL